MTEDVPSVSPEELKRRIDAGEPVTIIDTRNRDEVEAWRIEGADEFHVVPYVQFVSAQVRGGVEDLVADVEGRPVVTVCPEGEASAEVAGMLNDAGIEAVNLAGGMFAWARLYEAHELDADAGGATVVQYRRPSSGCLAYVVHSGEAALVVDPLRAFTDRYVADADARDVSIEYVFDTHVHADHVSGLRELVDATGATPLLSEGAVERGVTYDAETLTDGDSLQVGDVTVETVATPGHTTGMLSVRVGDVLLVGDTLFVESVPRPDLEDAADAREFAGTLYDTLTDRFARFDDGVVIAPGHYSDAARPAPDGTYTASLGELRERLGVFSSEREAFVERVVADTPPRPANFEEIIAINLGRASAGEQDAFELELGPNNCAVSPGVAD